MTGNRAWELMAIFGNCWAGQLPSLLRTRDAYDSVNSYNWILPCFRAWKTKRKPLRMRQTWKTPGRSRLSLGVRGGRWRSPRLRRPCVTWCPRARGPSGPAARPPSAWTPSLWSGTTRVTWGAPPLTKTTRRAHTTVRCQVRGLVSV